MNRARPNTRSAALPLVMKTFPRAAVGYGAQAEPLLGEPLLAVPYVPGPQTFLPRTR